MTGGTKIRWTSTFNPDGSATKGHTWNPTTGCSHVSDGCTRCYAEALSLRQGWSTKPWTAQNAAENVILHPDRLDAPRNWQRKAERTGERPRVFVNSMSDLHHDRVPLDFLDQVFAVMEACPLVTFQILTKRPERQRDYMIKRFRDRPVPTHIWIGTSVEDQRRANERIPVLLDTPASVRFLSCEPLLSAVDLRPLMCRRCRTEIGGISICSAHQTPLPALHWVIAGGESGPGFRPMDPDWARQLRDQCVAANVPFFYKQGSAFRTEQDPCLDGRRWEQFPDVPAGFTAAMERSG